MNEVSRNKKLARTTARAAREDRIEQRPQRDRQIQTELLAALSTVSASSPSIATSSDVDPDASTSDSALTVAAFVPLPGEPGGADLPDVIAATGARVILPRVSKQPTPHLEWIEYQPDSPNLVSGVWGIREPEGNIIHNFPACADVIITPGLAIDYKGTRLGQGGGFYDRALAHRPPHVKVWALVDHEEFTRTVPSQDHDLVVDAVLNDLGFFPID